MSREVVQIKSDWPGHPDLSLTLEVPEGHLECIIVHLNGNLGTGTGNGFQRVMQELATQGYTQFILDCERLTYLGSLGMGPLVELNRTAEAKNGGVILVALPDRIAEIISKLGLGCIFTTEDTLSMAMDHL